MPPDTSSKHLVRTQVAPSAVSSLLPARCSRCLHILLCPRLFHSSRKKFSSRSRSLRRSSVRVCARYDPGSTNPQTSYSSPIPANLRSAVHAVPFNQQVLTTSVWLLLVIACTEVCVAQVVLCCAAFDSVMYTSSCTRLAIHP